jgi:DNA-binding response OmpR family regulator
MASGDLRIFTNRHQGIIDFQSPGTAILRRARANAVVSQGWIGERALHPQRDQRLIMREVISFGHFRLFPTERLLEKNDVSVRIGGRSLDLLIYLAERPGRSLARRERTNSQPSRSVTRRY